MHCWGEETGYTEQPIYLTKKMQLHLIYCSAVLAIIQVTQIL